MSEIMTGINSSEGKVDKKVARGFLRRMSTLIDRSRLGSLFGQSFGGKRDYYEAFGWTRDITPENIWEMYHRGGIARRVVDAFPSAIWSRPPQLYIKGNTAWNTDIDKLVSDLNLWAVMKRLDIMVSLGRYACLVIGTDKGDLSTPQAKGAKITYLQPYAEKDIRIQSWDNNPMSPRFGRPETYQVYPKQASKTLDTASPVVPVRNSFIVHHSRILHIVRDPLENEDYGTPIYASIWNYLTDLDKVVGSSSESYWLTAFPGLHANVDKEMELEPGDEANLSGEIDEYMHSMRRFIRTRGVDINAIGGKVADPGNSFEVLLTLISGTTGIPKRILLGSEAGQLASTQDKGNWAERIEERRGDFCQPYMIKPFLKWLDTYEIFPTNINEVTYLWPEAYRMSPLERSQQSAQIARTLANINKGLQPIELTPGTPDVVDPTTGQVTPGTAPVLGDPLLTRDEARRLIGLSSDQQLLLERPE